ncbi:MAG: DUF1015 domain-containing protein [Gemmatimonadales bacterium]
MTDGSLSPLVTTFIGERYRNAERWSELVAPPYDVISPEQRRIYRERSEYNIVRLILPGGNGDRYTHAATILQSWRDQNVLVQDPDPAVYVVRQEFETPDGDARVRTGVIGAVAVEPYDRARVRPHEKTHKGPKDDRLALMQSTRSMFEALLLMSRDRSGELRDRLQTATSTEPDVQGSLEGVGISLWRVSGPAGEEISRAAAADGSLYIADGHHRYETAEIYRSENPEADRTLGLIVPLGDPGLEVLPTHRIIGGEPVHQSELLAEIADRFDVITLVSAHDAEAHLNGGIEDTRCVVYFPGPSFLGLSLRKGADLSTLPFAGEETVLALDVARIDHLIVDPIVRLAGTRAKVSYSPSTRMVMQRVYTDGASAAVLMNPTAVEQVLAVADAGAFMPQKSTYFAPKVPSGLVILSW